MNHGIDNMHKCSSGGLLLILNLTQPIIGFCKLDHTLTKRGLESVLKAQKCVWEPAKSAASKGGGSWVFIAPLKN
jgi:hypothetical protein